MARVHQEEGAALSPLFAALLLLGCASPPAPEPWPAARVPPGETVGWLDDQPVTYGEVARYLRSKDPEAFSRGLEGLVLERVTRAETGALGIPVPAPLLRRSVEERMREWEAALQRAAAARGRERVDPALWLERTAGISLSAFRRQVRRHTEVELLQDRLLRYEQLTSPRVEVLVLVVEQEDLARRLAERARSGEDFAALAREHSVHATAQAGGALGFPLLPLDVNDAAVREALFEADPGAVLGPFPTVAGTGKTYHQLYRLMARAAAERRPYAELRARIETELEKRPVPVGEYERWRRRILLRHGFVAAPAPGDAG